MNGNADKETSSRWLACSACDQLIQLPLLKERQAARCRRCGHEVAQHAPAGHRDVIACLLAAFVFLMCALFFPMLGFSAQGRTQGMTLLDSGLTLLANQEVLLGLLVLTLIVVIPCALILLLAIVLVSLELNILGRQLPLIGRWYYQVRHWNMVEVYVLGVVVSLTKITALAKVEYGLAIWALLGFAASLMMAINRVDKVELWDSIRRATPQRDALQ